MNIVIKIGLFKPTNIEQACAKSSVVYNENINPSDCTVLIDGIKQTYNPNNGGTINYTDDKPIWHGRTLAISIKIQGYKPYNKIHTIYGYDYAFDEPEELPNEFNVICAPLFDIVMVKEKYQFNINGEDKEIQLPYTNFIVYRQPLTNMIHIADLSSSNGTKTFEYSMNLSFTKPATITGNMFCNPNELCVRAYETITTTEAVGCECGTGETYTQTCLSNPKTIYAPSWFPTMDTSVESPCMLNEDSISINHSILKLNTLIGIGSVLMFANLEETLNPSCGYVLKVVQLLADSEKLLRVEGNNEKNVSNIATINIDTTGNISSVEGNSISFISPDAKEVVLQTIASLYYTTKGDISISNNLTIPDNFNEAKFVYQQKQYRVIEGIELFDIIDLKDNTVRIMNLYHSTINVNSYILKNKEWLPISELSIATCEAFNITHSKDGVYRYVATMNGLEEEYIFTQLANIEACMLKESTHIDKPAAEWLPVDLTRKATMSLLFIYLNKLIDIYKLTEFKSDIVEYTAIDSIWQVEELIDKLLELCSDCNMTHKSVVQPANNINSCL